MERAQCKDTLRRLSNPFLDLRVSPGRIVAEAAGLPLRRAGPIALSVLLACGPDCPSRPPAARVSHPVAEAPAPVWSTADASLATIASEYADGRATVAAGAADGATVSAIATVGSVASTAGGLMTIDPAALYVETISVAAAGGTTSFS